MSIRVVRRRNTREHFGASQTVFDQDIDCGRPFTLGSDPRKCSLVLKGLAGNHCTMYLETSLVWVACSSKAAGLTFLVTSDCVDDRDRTGRISLVSHMGNKERPLYQLRQGDRLILLDGQGGDWEITLTSLEGGRRRSSGESFNFGGGTQAYCPVKKRKDEEEAEEFDMYSEGADSDRTLFPNENDKNRANDFSRDSLPPGLDDTMKFPLEEQGQSLSPVVPLLLTSGEVHPEDIFGGRDSLPSLASFGQGSVPAIRPSTPGADPRASIGTVSYCPGTSYKENVYHDIEQDSDTRPYGGREALKEAPTLFYGAESESAPPTPLQDSGMEDDLVELDRTPLSSSPMRSLTPEASYGAASVMAKTRRVPHPDDELVCSGVDEAVNPTDFPLHTIMEDAFGTGMTISSYSDGEPSEVRKPQPKPKAKSKAKAKGRPKAKARGGRRSPQSTASKRSRKVKVEDDSDMSSIEAPHSPVSKNRRRRRSAVSSSSSRRMMKEEAKIAICFSTECRPSPFDERRISACGGRIVNSVSDDVAMFVAGRLKRTAKLMCAICRGIPVVDFGYIRRCFDRGDITQPYDVGDWMKDASGEKHWGFTLSESIKLARDRGPVLKGYQIHCATKNTATKDFRELVAAAGGTYLNSLPARIPDTSKDSLLVIVENRETRGDLRLVRKLRLPRVYVKELVMAAATTQELNLAEFGVDL